MSGLVLTFIGDGEDFLLEPLACQQKLWFVLFVLVHDDGETYVEKVGANVDKLLNIMEQCVSLRMGEDLPG